MDSYILRTIYNEYIEVNYYLRRRKPIMKKLVFILMAVLALKTGYGDFDVVELDAAVVYDYNAEA